MTHAPAPAGLIDPLALIRIESLQVRARVVVDGFLAGLHRSLEHGFSVEFSEYREYTPGDDPRHLDWRLFARSDRYYIKRFEDETNLRCTLVLDVSRSMGYGSGAITKAEYARTAAATIAYYFSTRRDAVGLVTFEDRVTEVVPPRHRPGHLRRLMAILERPSEGKATDLAGPIDEVAETSRRRGLIVLISDLLAPAEALRPRLGRLRAKGHEVVVLRVVDPAEADFGFETPAMFLDAETGREMYIDPSTARADYLRRFAAHADAIARACADLGVDLVSTRTDAPLELVLFDLLRARLARARRPGRRVGPSSMSPGGR